MASLCRSHQRAIYLVTYSRADIGLFPTKESFAEAVLKAWECNGVTVEHWVVSLEGHADCDGDSDGMNVWHYHMAMKLVRKSRWLRIRKYLDDTNGIKVNFSDRHSTYYSAYKYVTKEDSAPIHSLNHPDLSSGPPRTESAVATRKGKKKEKGTRKREKALTIFDVAHSRGEKNKQAFGSGMFSRATKATWENGFVPIYRQEGSKRSRRCHFYRQKISGR